MTETAPLKSFDDLASEIAELAAHIDGALCRLMDLILEFDQRGGWDEQGCRDCAEWLSWRLSWERNTAREHLRVAEALSELPELHEAFATARVSYSKMRALTRIATPETEAEWLNIALHSTADQCAKIVRSCRQAERAEEVEEEQARHQARGLRTYYDELGMFVIEGRLQPEVGAVVDKAIEAAMDEMRREQQEQEQKAAPPAEPSTTLAQREADALVRIAERSLSGEDSSRPGDRYQVIVHVDAEVLADPSQPGRAHIENGPGLSAGSLRRLTCDGNLITMLHDADGNVLNVGRKTRSIPTNIRRALQERDKGCRFPGCNCRYVDGHHLEHWLDGGETELSNLILMCRRHHGLVHERGFRVELDGNGEAVFYKPNGEPIPNTIVRQAARGQPVEVIKRLNEEAGLQIEPDTNLPEWDGEIPQYEYIAWMMTALASSRRAPSPNEVG
jgi:hypothetical protein